MPFTDLPVRGVPQGWIFRSIVVRLVLHGAITILYLVVVLDRGEEEDQVYFGILLSTIWMNSIIRVVEYFSLRRYKSIYEYAFLVRGLNQGRASSDLVNNNSKSASNISKEDLAKFRWTCTRHVVLFLLEEMSSALLEGVFILHALHSRSTIMSTIYAIITFQYLDITLYTGTLMKRPRSWALTLKGLKAVNFVAFFIAQHLEYMTGQEVSRNLSITSVLFHVLGLMHLLGILTGVTSLYENKETALAIRGQVRRALKWLLSLRRIQHHIRPGQARFSMKCVSAFPFPQTTRSYSRHTMAYIWR